MGLAFSELPWKIFEFRLLAMPRQRDILNPLFAGVLHQRERQRIWVRAAELVGSSQLAIFRAVAACFLNCDRVAGDSNVAPDLSLGLRAYDAKASIGIDRPHRAQRVGPLARERAGTGARDSFASSNHCY